MYKDGEECIQFIDNMGDEKVCMIISGSLGQEIVPRVHNMSQVDSIFIFCDNKKLHEEWTKEWNKTKGVFTEISLICQALKQAAQQCEQNAISMSFVGTDGDSSKKNLDQLDASFMYTQIMKEILLTIEFESKHFQEFIEYCCVVLADNQPELKNVKRFERKYCDETPIWWYTLECFLYPMLNRALRLMDTGIMIKIGFFIGDLHRQIEKLHKEQFSDNHSGNSFTVYRGQGMSKAEFEKMNKTKDGLISFNNFLSTSKISEISLPFATEAVMNPDLVGVLFVMTIDPSESTTPFASIADVAYYKDREAEVLFAMHSVFRINDIKPMDENHRLFQVELTLTSDNDKDLCQLTDRIREETERSTGWDRLGELLLYKMGEPEKAQQVYDILLKQTTKESEKAHIYHRLAWAKNCLGEFKEALILNEQALEIRQQSLPPNHPDLAKSYNNIGLVCDNMGEYSKALSYYEKTLVIQQVSLPSNHPDLAKSYITHGLVYWQMGEYSKSIGFYEKALVIQQQSLPQNHPDLVYSYNNIGLVYYSMGEYSKAVSYFERTLEIQQQSLPPNHPDLAVPCGHIGNVYSMMGDYSKAFPFCERAVDIAQRTLPSDHFHLQWYRNNLDRVKQNL